MSYEDTMSKVNPYKSGMFQNLFTSYQAFPALITVTQDSTPRLMIPDKSYQQVKNGNGKRLKMVIPSFQRALAIQLHSHQNDFPALTNALTKVGTFPLGMDLRDYRGCLDPRISYNESAPDYEVKTALERNMPLFTVCRSFDCSYSFPIPNYGDYQVMKMADKMGWDKQQETWNAQFPWDQKLSKVYWRGGMKGARVEFLDRVKTAVKDGNSTYLDVKEAGCPKNADPDFCSPKEPLDSSMKYKAVCDIDGNSWSARFPRLLCYNSAVIKVTLEEDYEEYFMADLQPNVHFIPASLDNFTYMAEYYMK
ncbi:unnamed protein product [Cylindrotheca closterium]|uniref:Glycosyl transferase CAP10 domain-containing protein n=1 Tax=Cylindrotheca closterium TaxID=2856 RepID=A0AAD2FBB2_9STRA|nr:unnamed protein product [Cylindrotheca closterium]